MLDFSQKREPVNNLIDAGTYEVTCTRCEQAINNFGDPIIALQWKIRDDVEQGFKGRTIFDDIRKDDEKSTVNAVVYNDTKIYNIVFGGQDQNDSKSVFVFDDYDELCQHLNGICMKIEVVVTTSAKTGKKYNNVKIGGYHPSQAKPKALTSPTASEQPSDGIDVADEDLPF